MLEMHKLTRYEHAPVLRFGDGFDAARDVTALASWLQDFQREKSKPPRRLSFTFHADDGDADSICDFMRLCVNDPVIRPVLTQAAVELVHAGPMSEALRRSVNERIESQRF